MRKIIFLSVTLFFLIFMTACDSGQRIRIDNNTPSTNLSDIYIESLKIGNDINNADMSIFTHTQSQNDFFSFWFKEIAFKSTDNGVITEIFIREPDEIDYFINGKNDLKTIEQITDELGQNYNEYQYDRQQSLRAITYTDRENKINFTLVYSDYDNNLIWLILN